MQYAFDYPLLFDVIPCYCLLHVHVLCGMFPSKTEVTVHN
jgi:hypothetical protein